MLSSDLCFFNPNSAVKRLDTIQGLQTNRPTQQIQPGVSQPSSKNKNKHPLGLQSLSWPARRSQTEGTLLALSFHTNHQTTLSMVPSSQTAASRHRRSGPLPVEAGSADHLGFVSHIVPGRHAFHSLSQLELNQQHIPLQHLQHKELFKRDKLLESSESHGGCSQDVQSICN